MNLKTQVLDSPELKAPIVLTEKQLDQVSGGEVYTAVSAVDSMGNWVSQYDPSMVGWFYSGNYGSSWYGSWQGNSWEDAYNPWGFSF